MGCHLLTRVGSLAAGTTEKGDKFMAYNVYGLDGVMRRCW